MTNSFEDQDSNNDLQATNLSYWRVPDPTGSIDIPPCNQELSLAQLLDDGINYTQGENWVLRAKPCSPTDTDPIVPLYKHGSTLAEEAQRLEEKFLAAEFLFAFENAGIHTDWTLFIQRDTDQNPPPDWQSIDDIKMYVYWKASSNRDVRSAIENTPPPPKYSFYVRYFLEKPEKSSFRQIYDSRGPHARLWIFQEAEESDPYFPV